MPLSTETVEFNLAAQLLIIRNPTLPMHDECSILHGNGWTEATVEDMPEEGLPPTPGTKASNKLRKAQAEVKERRSGDKRDEMDDKALAATFGGDKRIYKPAGAEEV